jgi:hypothetical protein
VKERKPGGCFQHWRRREAYFPVYSNDTKNAEGGALEARAEAYASKDGNNALVLERTACATGEGKKEVSYNCLTLLPDRTKNLAICQKKGWKAVQARKFWHGRPPLTSWEVSYCESGDVDATPHTTRYRSWKKEIAWEAQSVVCSDVNGPVTYVTLGSTYQRTTTINRLSGLSSSNDFAATHYVHYTGEFNATCPDISDQNVDEDVYVPPESFMPSGFEALPYQICGGYWVGMQAFIDWLEEYFTLGTGEAAAALAQQGATTGTYSFHCTPITPGDDIYLNISVTVTLSDPYTKEALRADIDDLLAEWDLTDDAVYPWRYDMALSSVPLVTRNETEEARNPEGLFDENDPEEVEDSYLADPNASYIDGSIRGSPFEDGYPAMFTDDTVAEDFDSEDIESSAIQLPETAWKIDSVEGFDASDVSRGVGTEGTDWTFDEDCQKILLTPNNAPSYTNPLLPVNAGDYITVTYDRKLDVTGGMFDFFYQNSSNYNYGWWSGRNIPHSATQVTPDSVINSLPPFAWLRSDAESLWAQKYCETKMPWRSQNWFGPCGEARDATWDSEVRWPGAWPIEGDRGCIAAVDGGSIKVTLDSAALWLRVGDTVDFTNAGGGVTEANIEVTHIDGSGDGSGPGLWFKFAGGSLPTGTRVKSHGAPGFWWYDTDGKGEFLKNEWEFNYRDYVLDDADRADEEPPLPPIMRKNQETNYGMPRHVSGYTCQTKCIKFTRCSPAVLCFSPNADIDVFENGVTYPFDEGGNFVPDMKYGGLWIGSFRQVMYDLWSTEPEDPEDVEDDGACQAVLPEATIPMRPIVEARATVPAAWINGDAGPSVANCYTSQNPDGPSVGFTLRDGEYRLFLELEDMNNAGGNKGIVQLPIEDMDPIPGFPWQPWRTWGAMQTCICAEGIWHDDYEAVLPIWQCGAEPSVCSGHYPEPET